MTGETPVPQIPFGIGSLPMRSHPPRPAQSIENADRTMNVGTIGRKRRSPASAEGNVAQLGSEM
jgi:hypothetical protein